ncbi:hypothetical protein EV424DRAFT_976258 [Suillus variegatus]|nr:hypothetical protein EV424DRAFT_976258 [Suillus variegatus]
MHATSFWLSFALAMAGVERGSHHVAAFRAMTVLRIARLLAITFGTTTIMQSLKITRPLLTIVAYFVVFTAVLFSIIGIQSFKGSFRRNCYLQPTLGENQTQISQSCSGYTLNALFSRHEVQFTNTTIFNSSRGRLYSRINTFCLRGHRDDCWQLMSRQ